MSDAEWAVVRDLLPVPGWLSGRGGRPEGYCHRQMIDAVRYLVDNGIKWRAMPADFPPWPRVYAFFARWRDTGLVTELHDRLREAVRAGEGRSAEPSAGIVDSQSVKADATVTFGSRGFDAGKKINGRKRHLLTDTLGLVLDIVRRSEDVRGFQALPRRWVVERSFAWFLRSRRLVRDYERRPDTSEAVIRWSMIALMSRRLAARSRRPAVLTAG
ncbi:transposase [Streptomyces ambofaciens ATCC 23877]|uniref:Transposase n=1 Tax=Streptomyces ambofaciens (strain ATCC 23877 / 3486 / DSM 40053 / JCM 4204 / NBRC 12836 / NRRL B-2516) TaxID=278992 RepID=A0A0K2AW65_STRA7|nr:transposase [Streptomyces ambofaciens]AKZ57380.1 transposase [Streptomyces ambofaciens ATCC 23877]